MPNNCSFWPRHWLSRHCICSLRRRQTLYWVPIRGRGCQQTHLSQVVEVVLVVHPLVVGCHAVGAVGDVPDVNPQAVVELALEKLQEGSDPIRVTFSTGFATGFLPHAPWDVAKMLHGPQDCKPHRALQGHHQHNVEHRLKHCKRARTTLVSSHLAFHPHPLSQASSDCKPTI